MIRAPATGFLRSVLLPLKSDFNNNGHLAVMNLYNVGPLGSFEPSDLAELATDNSASDCSGYISVEGADETNYLVVCSDVVSVTKNDHLWVTLRLAKADDTGHIIWQGSEQSLSAYGTSVDTACCKGSPVACATSFASCQGGGTAHDLGFRLTLQNAYCSTDAQQCISIGN